MSVSFDEFFEDPSSVNDRIKKFFSPALGVMNSKDLQSTFASIRKDAEEQGVDVSRFNSSTTNIKSKTSKTAQSTLNTGFRPRLRVTSGSTFDRDVDLFNPQRLPNG